MGNSPEHYFKTQKAISKPRRLFQNPDGYFKTQKAISKIIGEILNGDFIQSYIRYTINTEIIVPY